MDGTILVTWLNFPLVCVCVCVLVWQNLNSLGWLHVCVCVCIYALTLLCYIKDKSEEPATPPPGDVPPRSFTDFSCSCNGSIVDSK